MPHDSRRTQPVDVFPIVDLSRRALLFLPDATKPTGTAAFLSIGAHPTTYQKRYDIRNVPNIEFSCRPESESMLSVLADESITDIRHSGGQLQRFVRHGYPGMPCLLLQRPSNALRGGVEANTFSRTGAN